MRHSLSPVLLTALLALPAAAQGTPMKPFRVSPAVSLSHDLGISTLKVDYARPAVKGRKVWGELVPFGQVWRTGANSATTLTFSHPVRVAGKDVPAGSYALFAIPGEKSWTLILNSEAKQWGAYAYKADKDVARWEVAPKAIANQEWLTYEVEPRGEQGWHVELRWEKVAVPFDVDVDVRGIYWAHLEEVLATAKDSDWKPWYQAADYCLKQGIKLDKAMVWIDASLKAGESFWNLECKARLMQKAGKTKEAIPFLDRAVVLAEGKAPKEYVDGLKQTKAGWLK